MKEFDYSKENLKRTIREDYFGRNIYIKNLINYVKDSGGQATFAISGAWGSGKTVFMHQFMTLLDDQELINKLQLTNFTANQWEFFYYNAWENELLKRPSIALLYDLVNKYYVFNLEEREIIKDLFNMLSNIVVKIGTAGILNSSDFTISNSDEIDIKKINDTFSEAINYILNKTNHKKLIIIIDELDRCKPTNVIKLLEELKHFYSHDSLCFLISADLKQLAHTIKKLYGSEFDSDLYLQRFFDATFTLNGNNYEKYIANELDFDISRTYIVNEICKVAIAYTNLTIREINKFIKKPIIAVVKSNAYGHGLIPITKCLLEKGI